MELWQIIVALIQGLVEWLPISSEGQVVLFLYNFTPVPPDQIISLVVWLHLGTALAVVVRYPRVIFDILSLKDKKLLRILLVATLSTAITAVPLYFFLKDNLAPVHGELLNILVGVLLLVTAIVLYLPTRREEEDAADTERDVENKEAATTGLVQGLAVLPGLSRSGVTISALLMQRIDKETAMKFSFLMSVPAVLAILLLEIITGSTLPSGVGTLDLIIIEGIVFVTGLASMEVLLRLARRISFWKLCLVLSVVAILFGIPALIS
ncbi:MAG: undecaprenyl-diphosphate phosphatase [Candidatus Thorarchaeota archaeon]|nr:undecaprenyl-diphosphate phosphatase [Candidatus Thorarchaeota archaeon]